MNIRKTNKLLLMTIAIFLAFFVFNISGISAADSLSKTTGLEATAGEASLTSTGITDIPTAIGKIIGAGLAFIGVIFFVLMIYGGFTWMLARGNEQSVTKAKDLITSAVIGLIIIMAAYAITYYVGNLLTGKNS